MNETMMPDRVLRIGLGFRAVKVVLTAVELGVFTHLGDGSADLPTLSRALGLHGRAARNFLDALVALDLLERDGGFYRNSREASALLGGAKPGYIGSHLKMANAIPFRLASPPAPPALSGRA